MSEMTSTGTEREAQVRCLQQDMVLSGVTRLPLFSTRKRLAEALVARGWRKADMSDTAAEIAAVLQPSRNQPADGGTASHWLTFNGAREVTGCHCGFRADAVEDCGWGDSVVAHLLEVGGERE